VLTINGRFRLGPQTGVQRVATELLSRLALNIREVQPAHRRNQLCGHAWEQAVLPARLNGQPLWSPCNTGPIAVASQVVTLHDAAVFDHPEWFSRSFLLVYRTLWPLLAKRSRRIVTVSQYSRDRLAAALGINAARIEVVANGVSPMFRPVPEAAAALVAERYGVVPGRYFATLSTIEPRKNLGLVLTAWERARVHCPSDMQLLVIGGGGASHVFARGNELATGEQVLRGGFVPDGDLPALIGGARALLYPSRYEGFGLPILEAMACGTAAVTTALTSLPEVGGDAALYIDPDDADGLAQLIGKLAASDAFCADRGEAGLARAAPFSWDAAAEQMRTILIRDLRL